jgi:pilus assembly protein CpaE
MPAYFLNTDSDAEKAAQVERKIREVMPDLTAIASFEAVAQNISRNSNEPVYILIMAPARDWQQLDRLVEIATRHRHHIFFILISDEISATDYKRLVRTGGAEWVATTAAAQEIRDIISKRGVKPETASAEPVGPVVVSFVPSAGGVGNSTLAIETAIQLKRNKETRDRRICLVDLDFQMSHICDYLDIEPRLQIEEIANDPERLDSQLFDIFVSRHSSKVDVIAGARGKFDACELSIGALDSLFGMMSTRYDFIVVDLPVTWFEWTPQVLSASEGIIVTGINSIPGLRQISHNLAAIRGVTGVFGQIAVAVNRCETGLFGRVARRQHVESVIARERLFYIRNDSAALESINMGTPLTLMSSRRKVSRDTAGLVAFCLNLKSTRIATG